MWSDVEKPIGSIAMLYILVVKLFTSQCKKGRNAGRTQKCCCAFKAGAEETELYLFCVKTMTMLVCTVKV